MENYYLPFKLRLLVIIALLAGYSSMFAQSYWMRHAGSVTPDEAYSVSLDDSDNTYTTGYFSGTANFSPFTVSTLATSDIFVAKTNSSGQYKWVVKAGDGGSDRGEAIKTDKNGNSYVTGYYYGTAIFGTYTITSAGLQDVFVAKYDRNGNIKWVVSAGGTEADIGNAIALDNAGNVLITGQFTGTATFGTYTLTSTADNINIFTAKLDSSNGNFLWAKSGTGPHTNRGLGIGCDASNNVYITGSYTDTITFDITHYTDMWNAIFLVKYNSAGVEQWFTNIGGGTYNIANALTVDQNSDIYLTGDFQGTITFFAHTWVTLAPPYSNSIFVAKYDQNANLLWDVADGSSSQLTSRNIAVDASGNAYIIGNFECVFNGEADHYGQGTFNSVGYWDIFTSEYSTSGGTWQWSRQIGGHGNNFGYGIALSSTAGIYTAGSFDSDMVVTIGPGFKGYYVDSVYSSYTCNTTYCSDSYYGDFAWFLTYGNLDIFTALPIDLNRQPYDFYYRTGSSCNRPYEGVCINALGGSPTSYVCQDTVQFCVSGVVSAVSNTCDYPADNIGPAFRYKWSNGSTRSFITATATKWYKLTQYSPDGCSSSTDSIYVIIHPDPPKPTISDNVVINTDATHPKPVKVCKDSIILMGRNYTGCSYYWTSRHTFTRINDTTVTIYASDSDIFSFVITDSNGCWDSTSVLVVLDSMEHPIIPKLICETCRNDSAFLCPTKYFVMFAYDSISNPTGSLSYCIPPSISTILKWNATPSTISYANRTSCLYPYYDQNDFTPSDSGWYHITVAVIRNNSCGTDTNYAHDSVFVRLYPNPIDTLKITGDNWVCPGDSTWLVAHGTSSYRWSTGQTTDSIFVPPGYYSVLSTVTTSHGCSITLNAGERVKTDPQPFLSMIPSNGLICPFDSVEISCSSADGSFVWQGPSGPFGGTTSIVYVNTAGNYNCIRTDTNGCVQLSNTVRVEQYATPYLAISPSYTLCAGDSAKLSAVASIGAVITWLPPLSGHDSVQYVKATGTYSCQVVSCGITTIVSANIVIGKPDTTIHVFPSNTICANGDTVILSADSGMAYYNWLPGNVNAQSITVTQAGTYSLTVVDQYGCTASAFITIYLAPAITDTASSIVNISCNGGNNGSITLHINGGETPYTYNWSSGATTSSISGLSAGIYTVTIGNKCGSLDTFAIAVTQPAILMDSISVLNNVKCFGTNSGSIILGVSGGTPVYTYSWSNGATTSSISNLSIGTYTVLVTDKNGCTTTATATLTQPTALILSSISNTNEICNGGNTATASVSVSGGTPSYTYSWIPGGQTNSTATGLSAGTYTVIITDSLGCSLTNSVIITQPPPIVITFTTSPVTCMNNNGSISASISGGTSPYTYLWSPGGSTNSSISGLSSGTYSLLVTDANGCTDTASVYLGFTNNLDIAITGIDTSCMNQFITLSASGASTYIWSTGSTSSTIVVDANDSTYWVIGSEGPCIDSAKFTAHIYSPMKVKYFSHDTVCKGKSVQIVASFTGGKPNYNYDWNNGITSNSPGPFTLYPQFSTTYKVTITDECMTSITDSTTVFVTDAGQASFSLSPSNITSGEAVNFTNTSQNSVYYYWNFGDSNHSVEFEPVHTYTAYGTYQIILIVYTSYGCEDTAKQDLYVNPKVFLPNIFTPNGDGANDILYFTIEGALCYHCTFYDRWGIKVFESENMSAGWNGKDSKTGLTAPDGVYYYILDYCDVNNNNHEMHGFVQVIGK